MKTSLSKKLTVYFLIVIILSLASVGVFSYLQSSRALEAQSERYVSQVITSASYQTDLYLQTYERASESLLSNLYVKRFLDINPQDSYSYFEYLDEIQKTVFRQTFILYPQINTMYIIGTHGRVITDDSANPNFDTPMKVQEKFQYLNQHTPDNGTIVILNSNLKGDANVVTMARKIRGVSSYYVPNGVLAIEFRTDELAKIWRPLDLGEKGFFFIVDENGQFVYRPSDPDMNHAIDDKLIQKIIASKGTAISEKRDGQTYMFVSRKSSYSNWSLVVSTPLEELRRPIATIRTTVVAVGLLTLLAATWLAIRFGRSITQPIRMLKEGMRETEKGNWSYLQVPDRQDELGGLMHSYNLMVTRLSDMIKRVYEAELSSQRAALDLQQSQLERHQAEFQALQLQINPHFLYNTLETIKCYAVVQDSNEITEMVEAMAFMLRYSIQTNLEEITVANELRHVLSYMAILQHRIQREFELDVVIPPEYLLDKMVRLTLQPLIENVFQHAFPQGIESHHFIRVDAKVEKDRFLIIVEDNGEGMTPERLAMLRDKLKLNQLAETAPDSIYHRGGIGLMNVHRRIQMVFGEQYGLSIESELHKGTRTIMSMPIDDKRKRKRKQLSKEDSFS